MPPESNDPSVVGEDALGEALRIYLEHRAAGSGESDAELLQRNPRLRELLEPLLQQDLPSGDEIRPGAVIGDYRLVEAIGRGGMGEVWEAEQISLKRRVALKLLRAQVFASARSVERFRREALAGARLRHPCIVAVHSVGESGGVHFIAQELIESRRTLSSLVREMRDSPAIPADWWRDTAQIFENLADALQLAHESGIIHRDIKPSNILLAKHDIPKIADFGLALVAGESELSRTGDFSGSPFYMSPEQAAAKRVAVDERSDIFSLGASMFEALTLQRPFEGDTVAQILTKILFHDPRDPREIRSMCPRDLAVICMKMLEKAPTSRYRSMREVADELGRFLRNEPIRARSPGLIGRGVKWSRRHPVLAASGSIVCVSLCVVSALLVENQRARDAAEDAVIQARISAEEARIESRTSSRITDFLVDAFVEASPARALGREVSAREVLERGVRNIREGLTEATEAGPRARLLGTLGMVYSRLGLRQEAEDLLLEAKSLGEATFGPSEGHTLNTATELLRLYQESGRLQPALELAASVYSARLEEVGAGATATLRAEANLGALLMLDKKLEDAEQHLRHALEGLEQSGDDLSPVLYGLAETLRRLGRTEESLATLQQCIDISDARWGPDAPDTLTARQAFAKHLSMSGDAEGAARLYRQIASSRACVQGALHPDTIATLREALVTESSLTNVDTAIPELRSLHASCVRRFGAEDLSTLTVAGELAKILMEFGYDLEAEDMYAFLIASTARQSIGSPVESCALLGGLGWIERRLGRPELALSLFEEVIHGPDTDRHPNPASLDNALRQALELCDELGRTECALQASRQWLAVAGEDHPRREEIERLVSEFEQELEDR